MNETDTPYLLRFSPDERARILASLPPLPSEPRILRELLRVTRHSKRELAERIGVDYWRIEQGLRDARPFTPDELAKVREALGVSELELLAARQAAAERVR